jgi:hypothetical protein
MPKTVTTGAIGTNTGVENPPSRGSFTASELLKSIGIEKCKPFNPDLQSSKNLAIAAQETHTWFENRFQTSLPAFYSRKQWLLPVESICPGTQATFVTPEFYGLDAALFRFYGPQPALFEKTWQLPDIEKAD